MYTKCCISNTFADTMWYVFFSALNILPSDTVMKANGKHIAVVDIQTDTATRKEEE